jgi:hypothetical protein
MTKKLKLKIATFISIFLITVFSVYSFAQNQQNQIKNNNSDSSTNNSNSSLSSANSISSQISSNQNSSNSQNSQSSNSQNSTSSSSPATKTNQEILQNPIPQITQTNPKPIQNTQKLPISAPISSVYSLPSGDIVIPMEIPKKSNTERVDEKCARITNNSNLSDDAGPYFECMRQNGAEVIPM